ncbi:hypothetical protein K432DRAFT_386059, partial [Lepidopterella palustris CBS 459.81]
KYIDPSVENPPTLPELPIPPTPSTINSAAKTYYNLNPDKIQQYNLPLNSIYNYILATVSKQNLVYIREYLTPHSLL